MFLVMRTYTVSHMARRVLWQVIRAPEPNVKVDGNHPEPMFRSGDAALLARLARQECQRLADQR